MGLAIAPDDSFSNLPLNPLLEALVECLQKDMIPDIPYYALVSLTHLIDAIPNVSTPLAASGGIGAICRKLSNMEFIDMAEHAIKVLERLSYEHSEAILTEGTLGSVINMLDFFEIQV
mmetsp:Transcript_21818/g.3621  ORF Transcript_21818/g.3621 Transcript_21818/m.3621 type:complete len:118 (+) Transcript_21818:158-511(+)